MHLTPATVAALDGEGFYEKEFAKQFGLKCSWALRGQASTRHRLVHQRNLYDSSVASLGIERRRSLRKRRSRTMREQEDIAIIDDDPTKRVDYLAVCTLMYFLLEDRSFSTAELSTFLEYADPSLARNRTRTEVTVTHPGRAKLAQHLVDSFLCKEKP